MRVVRHVVPAARVLLIVTVIGITILSLGPPVQTGPEGTDKLGHFAAYAVLSFLAVLSGSARRPLVRRTLTVIAGAFAYGALMEFTQHFVGRNFEIMDMVANGVGAVCGACAGAAVRMILDRHAKATDPQRRFADRTPDGMLMDTKESE